MTVYAITGRDDSDFGENHPRCVIDMRDILDLANYNGYSRHLRTITEDGQLNTHAEARTITAARCLIVQFPSGRQYLTTRRGLSNYLVRQDLPQIAELEPA